MQAKSLSETKKIAAKRGRPKLTPLSQTEQAKLRMQRMRERKRREELVPVEIWIPKKLRDSLIQKGEDVNSVGREAFETLAKVRGY